MGHILEEALKLPDAERLKLTEDLYESLHTSSAVVEIPDEQLAELNRRIEDHNLHPDRTIRWEQVKAEALARK
ncbi:MAG TPA: addiction module protein [Pyrinomonadaceae bacterium]|nr:addiction module protein [Pyrinomonadaceae bacterium]